MLSINNVGLACCAVLPTRMSAFPGTLRACELASVLRQLDHDDFVAVEVNEVRKGCAGLFAWLFDEAHVFTQEFVIGGIEIIRVEDHAGLAGSLVADARSFGVRFRFHKPYSRVVLAWQPDMQITSLTS